MESPVQLLVYDLSQGMAKMLSLGLTGIQIDGIWHTSVVVYDKEYCFGQGIQSFIPHSTPYGKAVETHEMGLTKIPIEVFEEYIETQKTVWTAEKYHLFENNCNSFSDELCLFLVNRNIPVHITGLPAEFLATPFGQQIRPMVEGMFNRQAHALNQSALPGELVKAIEETVVSSANSHAHDELDLKFLTSLSQDNGIQFTLSSEIEKIFAKLIENIKYANLSATNASDFDDLQILCDWMTKTDIKVTTIFPQNWHATPVKLLKVLPVPLLFPLLDILRLLALNPKVREHFIGDTDFAYLKLITKVLDSEGAPTRLMLLKFICNLFSPTESLHNCKILNPESISGICSRDVVTNLVIETLISPDPQLRQASALLAFNICWTSTQIKKKYRFDEGWVCELLAALANAIEHEGLHPDKETTLRLVGAVGFILAFANESVIELAKAVELNEHLQKLKLIRSDSQELCFELISEIQLILK